MFVLQREAVEEQLLQGNTCMCTVQAYLGLPCMLMAMVEAPTHIRMVHRQTGRLR